MEVRKVQQMGGGTCLVSLPKAWVRQNSITRGSTVSLEETADGGLIIFPFRAERTPSKEIKIPYPPEYSQLLVNEVTAAYLFGYDSIIIQGKDRISYTDRELVKKAVRQLVGLEIVEEDARSLLVQFLLEPTSLEPEKIFRRIHMIVQGMHADAVAALLEMDEHLVKVVTERDEEVDRLYFLLVRLIRSAILDSSLASKYHMNPIDCLDYRVASNVLETAGDASVELAKNAFEIRGVSGEVESRFRQISKSLQACQDLAVRAFLTRSAKDAREVVRLYQEVSQGVRDLERIMSEKSSHNLSATFGVTTAIEKISRCQVDIADLVAPVYPIIR